MTFRQNRQVVVKSQGPVKAYTAPVIRDIGKSGFAEETMEMGDRPTGETCPQGVQFLMEKPVLAVAVILKILKLGLPFKMFIFLQGLNQVLIFPVGGVHRQRSNRQIPGSRPVPDRRADARLVGKQDGRGATGLPELIQPFSGLVDSAIPDRLAQERPFGDDDRVAIRELTQQIAAFPLRDGFNTTKKGGVAGPDVKSVAVLVIERAIELAGMLQNQGSTLTEVINVVLTK